MKKYVLLLLSVLGILMAFLLVRAWMNHGLDSLAEDEINLVEIQPEPSGESKSTEASGSVEPVAWEEPFLFVDANSSTMATRILVPEGYTRIEAEPGSLLTFVRDYPLYEDGSAVHLYDGSEKYNQSAHVAVFQLPIEERDLQQCADSIMRMYAEYFRATGQYERIQFHFTNGFLAEYSKWREGYRISVEGNSVSWVQSAAYDDSYEAFVSYMKTVFAYAGTLSMEQESESIALSEICPGDVFLKGGSPGHVVMVVDLCENEQGDKAFLLAQGYMPAQEFHILKNPLHEEDPWYYESEIKYPLSTPEYVFPEGSLKRLNY